MKFGAAVTVRLIVVVCVKLPDVPVMVSVTGPPATAKLLAAKVNMLELAAGFGTNDAVTPLGKGEVTARFTLPVKPFAGFTVMVLMLLLP